MDNGMYIYTIREDSIMGNANFKLSSDLVEITEGLVEYVKTNHNSLFDYIFSFSVKFLLDKSRTIKNIKNDVNTEFILKLRTYFADNLLQILKASSLGIRAKTKAIALVLFNVLI